MAGLVPAIHAFSSLLKPSKAWMAATSTAMTDKPHDRRRTQTHHRTSPPRRHHRVGGALHRAQLAWAVVHAAGGGVPDPVPGLSARARHLDLVHRRAHRPERRVRGPRKLRVAVRRLGILALGG